MHFYIYKSTNNVDVDNNINNNIDNNIDVVLYYCKNKNSNGFTKIIINNIIFNISCIDINQIYNFELMNNYNVNKLPLQRSFNTIKYFPKNNDKKELNNSIGETLLFIILYINQKLNKEGLNNNKLSYEGLNNIKQLLIKKIKEYYQETQIHYDYYIDLLKLNLHIFNNNNYDDDDDDYIDYDVKELSEVINIYNKHNKIHNCDYDIFIDASDASDKSDKSIKKYPKIRKINDSPLKTTKSSSSTDSLDSLNSLKFINNRRQVLITPNTTDNDSDDNNNNSDNNSDNSESIIIKQIEQIIPMIPIIIIPCKNFEFPEVKNVYLEEKKLTKYFRDHHIKCNECEITNNNNINLREILIYDKNYDLQCQMSNENDDEIDDELEYYYNIIPHNPFIDADKTTIRIKYIINFDSHYDDCLFIQWIIKR
jgi:hypothetical protein